MSRKAYPIPDPIPEGLRCFMVAIPDDDLFLYQFMGAYRFFGTWIAWERDTAKRGKDAAAIWKQAIEWTENHMDCEFPDYTEIFEQWPFESMASSLALIAQRLETIEASQSQSQIIELYNDCCMGVGAPEPPEWIDGNTGTGGEPQDDPPGWDNQANGDYGVYKCKAANKLVADYVATLAGITGFSSLVGVIGAVAAAALMNTTALSGFIVGLMAIGLSAAGAVMLLLGTFITMILAGEAVILLIGDVANGLNKQELVCLLYDSVDSVQAKAAFTAATAAALAEVDAGEHAGLLAEFFARLLTVIVPEATMQVLFNFDEDTAEHVPQYDCDCVENIGLWVTTGTSSGYCATTMVEYGWNWTTRITGDVILSKTTNGGAYTFSVYRTCDAISSGTMNIVWEATGNNPGNWELRLRMNSNVVQTVALGAAFNNSVVINAEFNSVLLKRSDEIYTASCPRTFSIDLSLTIPGTSWADPPE